MATPSVASTIFCCDSALPVHDASRFKLHNDPNRELHEAIFHSFLAFAIRRQHSANLLSLIMGIDPTLPSISDEHLPQLAPIFNLEVLQNNPLTAQIPYVIHLTSRHDFGPVYSHRYFVCPPDLQQDWIEISLLQWFATGEPFKMKAEKWDLKCKDDGKFFRLTLRPNLAMRGCYPVSVGGVHHVQHEEVPVAELEHFGRGYFPEKLYLPKSVGGMQRGESVAVGGGEFISRGSLQQGEIASVEGLKQRDSVWNDIVWRFQ